MSGHRSAVQVATSLLENLSLAQLHRVDTAAKVLIDCVRNLAQQGRSVLNEVVGSSTPRFWQHYPANYAEATGGGYRYYYHCHPPAARLRGEHGHFHIFAPATSTAADYTHIVALSVDAHGLPLWVFATNRWVTGEHWLDANCVLRLAQRFVPPVAGNHSLVDHWIVAVLQLFSPQIAQVLHLRDARVAQLRSAGRGPGLFEDRRIHVLSRLPVSLTAQAAALDRVLKGKSRFCQGD